MARVTIEDCMKVVGSHFKVAQVAGRRAHQLEVGATPKIDRNGDKTAVIALRELAQGKIDESILDEPIEELIPVRESPVDRNIVVANEDIGSMVADIDQYSDINEKDKPDDDLPEDSDEQLQQVTPAKEEE